MRLLKVKTFSRWARREGLRDAALASAADEMARGLLDADLGGGLVKKRVARAGSGKRGSYRVLAARRVAERCVFLFGFSKSRRDNLDARELLALRRLAQVYLAMDDTVIERLIEGGELMEVVGGE